MLILFSIRVSILITLLKLYNPETLAWYSVFCMKTNYLQLFNLRHGN